MSIKRPRKRTLELCAVCEHFLSWRRNSKGYHRWCRKERP